MGDNVSFYLKIDPIKGGGTEKDHKGWIPIRAFAVSDLPHLNDKGRVDYTLHRINFVAPSDVSFSQLMRSASSVESFDLATLDQVKNSQIDATFMRLGSVSVVDCRTSSDAFTFALVVKTIQYGNAYVPQNQSGDPLLGGLGYLGG